jgi:hypothetical protein
LIVQEPPAATGLLVEQVVPVEATAKALAFAPVIAMLLMVSAAVPVLLPRVTDSDPVVPTIWLPNGRLDGETLATGAVPVPFRPTVCVLPVTPLLLSVMVSVPLSGPVAVGEKVTLIVQEPPAATGLLVEQVVPVEATAKALAFAPVIAMLAIVSAAVPVVLPRVTGSDPVVPTIWLPNVRLDEVTLATGAVPVPVKPTVCVLPATPLLLSVMVSVPLSGPVAVGEKVTLIVQEPPAATGLLVEQVVPVEATAKALAFAPVIAMLLMVSAAVPVALLRVTDSDPLVVPKG